MMGEIAGWVAPIATMLAAMMTAANLGPRVTGWGFVVFLIGSIGWSTVAIATGQQNLLWTNAFLSLVNLVGVWRWLGRLARYGDGARVAEERSGGGPTGRLFSVANVVDGPVTDADGNRIGRAIGAMAKCGGGGIAYVVVAEGGAGGVGERLHAIAWEDVTVTDNGLTIRCDAAALAGLPTIEPEAWPTRPPRALARGRSSRVSASGRKKGR